ncbi:MAG: D-glycero-beta-D-manno-heptose 1-phosphate adenylyltransferase [Microscillaceae bacterium]|jgi:rfaE bifunctional protein nucleotidyltransferase chain/domain|nr:D-glycero-beta-D-manno-heptose 1-phosphate adenylyltransferase [Microscillaceae bacterium]
MKNTAEKIYTLDDLKQVIQNWQQTGKQVVFTNGCFDIVHLGHIDYLEKARQKGDKLVVGLNSDSSVKTLKGESRPVIPEYARARMLAALEFVDAVVLFDENTPKSLIEALKPDILTKGNDYTVENIVGADFVLAQGGKVETLPLVDGFSTSQIIEKIKQFM